MSDTKVYGWGEQSNDQIQQQSLCAEITKLLINLWAKQL